MRKVVITHCWTESNSKGYRATANFQQWHQTLFSLYIVCNRALLIDLCRLDFFLSLKINTTFLLYKTFISGRQHECSVSRTALRCCWRELSFHSTLLVSRQLSVYCGGSAEAFLTAWGSCRDWRGAQFCSTLSARMRSDYTAPSFPSHLPHPSMAWPALSLLFRVPQKREGCLLPSFMLIVSPPPTLHHWEEPGPSPQ